MSLMKKKTITITDHSSNTWVYNAHEHFCITYTRWWPIKAVTYLGPGQPNVSSALDTRLSTRSAGGEELLCDFLFQFSDLFSTSQSHFRPVFDCCPPRSIFSSSCWVPEWITTDYGPNSGSKLSLPRFREGQAVTCTA